LNKEKVSKNEEEFLKEYNIESYERPSVTNDVIIFTTDDMKEENSRKIPKKGLQVLLIKRDDYPEKGKWAIPGGFVSVDESLEEGCIRKLKEETGIDNVYMEQLYSFGEVNRDPRTRVISVGNIALMSKGNINFVKKKTVKETKWFWIEKNLISVENDEEYNFNKYILKFMSEDGEIKVNYEITEKIERSILRRKEKNYKVLGASIKEVAFDHFQDYLP